MGKAADGIAKEKVGDCGKQTDAHCCQIQSQKELRLASRMRNTFCQNKEKQRCGKAADGSEQVVMCIKNRNFKSVGGQMVNGHEHHGNQLDLIGR